MKKLLLIACLNLFYLSLMAQEIPEHISYTRIYDFLDELANEGHIELNSVIKPYSKIFIANKLAEVAEKAPDLNKRQTAELHFFMNQYALELNRLPKTYLNIWNTESTKIALIQPSIQYKDHLFKVRVTPILGMNILANQSGSTNIRWFGVGLETMIGKHVSIWGSLRDISFKDILTHFRYLNTLPGAEYKESTAGAGDYSDSRGGIKLSWDWGALGFAKDNIIWGDNNHGSNIMSGRAPSYPMLTLSLKPVHWFQMEYMHGWLNSNVLDSTQYYVEKTASGEAKKYRPRNKYVAANMFTFIPTPQLNISFGNAIVYAESTVQPAFLIPIAFYKSIDHSMTKGTETENQNAMMFLNISSRNIKNLHLYTSVFVDEVKFARFKRTNPQKNPISFKLGATLSNMPVDNLTLMAEFTQTNIITYKHSIDGLTWASNDYNLGHYLGDNAREFYLALKYKPIRGLDVTLSYLDAQKGREYDYLRGVVTSTISQPVLDKPTWTNKTLGLNIIYEVFSNAYAVVDIAYSNIQGHNPFDGTTKPVSSEVLPPSNFHGTIEDFYLGRFTPSFLRGKNTTITLGFGLGF
jgi:hypothetical protein